MSFSFWWCMVGFASLLAAFSAMVEANDPSSDGNSVKIDLAETATGIATEQLEFFNKVKTGEFKKLGTLLGRLVEDYRENSQPGMTNVQDYNQKLEVNSAEGRVWVDAVLQLEAVVDESNGPLFELISLGFKKRNCRKNVCSGSAAIEDLPLLAQSVTDLVFFAPILKPAQNAGNVTSKGDAAMETDKARVGYGVTGAGVMVGAISDSYDCLVGRGASYTFASAADDIVSGDLPSGVIVLDDYLNTTDCTDEGRALLQIVHDVAPGARLAFHTARGGKDIMAQGILDLAALGCHVIVDDVIYPDESWFQDGEIAQAVDTVVAQGVTYVTSAGNYARDAWDSNIRSLANPYRGFAASSCQEPMNGSPLHNFGVDFEDPLQRITLEMNREYRFYLQWDEPHASNPGSTGSTSDLDFYLYNTGSCSSCSCVSSLTPLESSTTRNENGDPFELFFYTPSVSGEYGLGIALYSGAAPTYMKWLVIPKSGIAIPPNAIQYYVPSSTVIGHFNAQSTISVGAVRFSDTPEFGKTPTRREFSSAGGTPIFFSQTGTRLNSEIMREHPKVMGPDGVRTTFFRGNSTFPGTSASAPHIAGLAALMLHADPNLTPSQIRDLLQTYAIDMDDDTISGFQFGFDNATGYGFVDGLKTIDAISPTPAPTLAPTEAPCSCFSEATTVEVLGKGKVEMKHLRVGDEVLKGDDHYEPVYGFAHRHDSQLTEFLVFYISDTNTNSRTNSSTAPPHDSKPLEISQNHLLQVNDTFLPAKDVQVGDILHGEGNITVTVTGIEVVHKEGLFAPLTPSGTLLVNGIQVSCYVSLQKHLGHASIHLLITPVRMICLHAYGGAQLCSNDWIDEETGFPPYVVFAIGLLDFFDQRHLMVQILLYLVFVAIMLPLYGLEQVWLWFGKWALWAVVVVSVVWASKWKGQPSTKTRK